MRLVPHPVFAIDRVGVTQLELRHASAHRGTGFREVGAIGHEWRIEVRPSGKVSPVTPLKKRSSRNLLAGDATIRYQLESVRR